MPAMEASAPDLARGIAREFRCYMLDEYVPRIDGCVRRLTEAEVWHRPSPHCNAIGNLLLHLEGNVRQWILCGLGGEPDRRERASEFAAAQSDLSAVELVRRLRATVAAACDVVDRLTPQDLLARKVYQQLFDQSGLAAVLHVLEHFSGHAAQIYAYTKQLRGVDLQHYDL